MTNRRASNVVHGYDLSPAVSFFVFRAASTSAPLAAAPETATHGLVVCYVLRLGMVDVGEDDNSDEEEVTTDCAVVSQQQAVALSEALPSPTFGNIAVTNSTDIQFGNKTYYNGPVTIKQVVYTNGDPEGSAENVAEGTVVSCEEIHVPVDLKSKCDISNTVNIDILNITRH